MKRLSSLVTEEYNLALCHWCRVSN